MYIQVSAIGWVKKVKGLRKTLKPRQQRGDSRGKGGWGGVGEGRGTDGGGRRPDSGRRTHRTAHRRRVTQCAPETYRVSLATVTQINSMKTKKIKL